MRFRTFFTDNEIDSLFLCEPLKLLSCCQPMFFAPWPPNFLAFPDESGFLSACVDAQAGPLPLQQASCFLTSSPPSLFLTLIMKDFIKNRTEFKEKAIEPRNIRDVYFLLI